MAGNYEFEINKDYRTQWCLPWTETRGWLSNLVAEGLIDSTAEIDKARGHLKPYLKSKTTAHYGKEYVQ